MYIKLRVVEHLEDRVLGDVLDELVGVLELLQVLQHGGNLLEQRLLHLVITVLGLSG